MPTVTIEGLYKNGQLVGIIVCCPYRSNSRAKSIPSCRWDNERKGWRYKLDLDVINQIEQKFTEAELPEDLRKWRDLQMKLQRELLDLQRQQDATLQSEIASKLYGFQRVGVKFLTEARRAILADDMGLGKTVQSITACEELQAKRILIICPNTMKDNWAGEIKKWTPDREVTVLRGYNREKKEEVIRSFKSGYLIVNYEAIRRSKRKVGNKSKPTPREHDLIDDLYAMSWDVIIVDEAHNIKNRKASQTEGVRKLAAKTENIYLLTGTPIMNRVDELWSPLNILYPKQYSSFWTFVKKHTIAYPGRFGWVIDGKPTQPEELRQEIAPIFLRREKEEVFPDMPRKVYQKVWVNLEGEQRRIYQEIEQTAMTQIDENTTVITPSVLAKLTRCKQVAISPRLIGGKPEGVKIDVLIDILHGTNQKVLIFSQFAKAVKLVAERLKSEDIGYVTFTGETSENERNNAIKQFQTNPEVRVFLATMQTGGTGVTLTAASLVIFLDKHWTPAINEQAVDRTRPHLQKQPIQIIEILARDTIDEMVEDVLQGKVSIVEAVIARRKKVKMV